MLRKPVITDFNDFLAKVSGNDESVKRQLFEDILYAQKERARLREKSKRQRDKKKVLPQTQPQAQTQ